MVIFLILFLLFAGNANATALSDLVAGMEKGTWATLTPGGKSNLTGLGNFEAYADSGNWDPIRKRFQFCGSVHGGALHCLAYDEATNAWLAPLAVPFQYSGEQVGHAYDTNTIDQVHGFAFYRHNGTNDVYKYDIANNTWSQLPSLGLAQPRCCGMLVYFPNYAGVGGLIFLNNGYGPMQFLPDGAGSWQNIANSTNLDTSEAYHSAEYNPIYGFMVFATDENNMFKLTADGTITQYDDNPTNFYDGGNAQFTVDPVTGNYYELTATNRDFWQFNPITDTWSQPANGPPNVSDNDNFAQAADSTHGVTIWAACGTGSTCSGDIYVYKGGDADDNFVARCAAPGVQTCQGFNSMGTYGNADLVRCDVDGVHCNIQPNGSDGYDTMEVDTTIKASGAGSLKFTLLAGRSEAQMAGQYLPIQNNGLGGSTFAEGDEFYVQYRVRYSPEMFSNLNNYWGTEHAFKSSMFHYQQQSCGGIEITHHHLPNNTGQIPNFYTDCGSGHEAGFRTDPATGLWKSPDDGTPYTIEEGDYNGGCNYGSTAGCWTYTTNEWLTFMFHVKVSNPWGTGNGQFDVWVSRPSLDDGAYKLIKHLTDKPYTCNTNPCSNNSSQGFNNVTLTNYMTGCCEAAAPVNAYVWYDELIVSTQPIAAPMGGLPSEEEPPASVVARTKVNTQ